MMQLHDRDAVFRVDLVREPRQSLDMVVRPYAQLTGKTLSDPLHMSSTCHGETESAFCAHG